MNKQAGFTLIELVAVMVILALLGAMAVPRFADVQTSAVDAVKDGTRNAVRSAHSIGIAKFKDFPTVTDLAGLVGGDTAVTAAATGLQFAVSGDTYTVETFTDATCGSATAAVGDKVRCVGTVTGP
jgi:prepilin-type N-terminal cleavage/methylation domain-containing protein